MNQAVNGNIKIGNTDMDYISFGSGTRNLIMLPGLGDGLKTVKGTASAFAMMYRRYAKNYKVYVFSRKNQLETGYSTRDMARDQATAMKELGIYNADIIGISQGGMIAQYFAIDYPEMIRKLILTVTISRQNKTIQETIGNWIKIAETGNYKELMIDTAEKMYTEKYLKRYRRFYPILGKMGDTDDFERFLIQAWACLQHDAYEELAKIKCPTLVIGADQDRVLEGESSKEIAERISGSKLVMYEGYGHGVYEEAKDFHDKVLDFLA